MVVGDFTCSTKRKEKSFQLCAESVQRFWLRARTRAPPPRHPVGGASHKDLGERVGAGAADVTLGGVERHVVDGLVELPAVGGELLDARSALHVPQADGTVVTWRHNRPQRGGERSSHQNRRPSHVKGHSSLKRSHL